MTSQIPSIPTVHRVSVITLLSEDNWMTQRETRLKKMSSLSSYSSPGNTDLREISHQQPGRSRWRGGSRGLTQGLPPPHGVLEPMKKIKAWVLSCHLEASGELNKKGWTTAEEAPSDSEVISEGVTHHAVSTRWLRKGNSISIIQACEQEALTSMSNIACQELARRKTGFFHALIPVFEVLRY